MNPIYEWLNKEKERFYKIKIEQSKNNINLKYSWGSTKSNRGGKKQITVNNEQEVNKTINQMIIRRKRRGYQLIAPY